MKLCKGSPAYSGSIQANEGSPQVYGSFRSTPEPGCLPMFTVWRNGQNYTSHSLRTVIDLLPSELSSSWTWYDRAASERLSYTTDVVKAVSLLLRHHRGAPAGTYINLLLLTQCSSSAFPPPIIIRALAPNRAHTPLLYANAISLGFLN